MQNFKSKEPLYDVWVDMRQRCNNPNFRQWKDYGGRGIKVCERWNDYRTFASDMGARPPGMRIERINNDGNYEPSNCRWATPKEQQRNQRNTRKVVIEGKTYIAADLADLAGIKTDAIVVRANRGLTYSEVVSPKRRVFKEGLALGGLANGKRQKSKTRCPHGHQYNKKNTYIFRGARRCRVCAKLRARGDL